MVKISIFVPSDAPPKKNRKLHGNAIVFTNLTQDDSQVLQCNASNIHGYLWADVYLQVIGERNWLAQMQFIMHGWTFWSGGVAKWYWH